MSSFKYDPLSPVYEIAKNVAVLAAAPAFSSLYHPSLSAPPWAAPELCGVDSFLLSEPGQKPKPNRLP